MAKTREEELKELAELEELAQLDAMEQQEWEPEQEYAPSAEELEAAKQQYGEEAPTGEAMAAGFVEGVPFLKDGVAAVDGIDEAMEDGKSFDAAYENYKQNLDEINQDLSAAEEGSPWAFGAGDLAGGAASFAAGGAAAKSAKALTGFGQQVLGSAVTGAAAGVSRSRDRSATDAMVGGTLGVTAEYGARIIGKGLKKGGRWLLDKSDDASSAAVKQILGIDTISNKRNYFKHLQRTNQKESEFFNTMLTKKMKGSDDLMINFSDKPERMLDKVQTTMRQSGDDLAKLYKEVDNTHKVEIDVHALKDGLYDDVVTPFLHSDDPGMNKIGEDLAQYIQKIGTRSKGFKKEVTEKEGTKLIEDFITDEKWSLNRTWQLQKDIRKRIEKIYKANGLDLNASKEQQRQVASSLGKHMDEVLESVSTPEDDLLKKVYGARKDFGNLATIEDSLQQTIYKNMNDPVHTFKNEVLSFKSLLISGMATQAMGPMGVFAGPAAVRMMNNPNTPIYVKKGMDSLAKVVGSAPTGRIATKLTVAAGQSDNKFKSALYGSIAEINLKSSPIARNTESAKQQMSDIRHYLKDEKPSMLKELDRVIELDDDEALAGFLDGLSKAEGANRFFQQGVGINGKVYSPEDKKMLESQLKSTDMPAAQRIEMLGQLRSNGLIPDLNSVVPVQPKVHNPRTKKMHNY